MISKHRYFYCNVDVWPEPKTHLLLKNQFLQGDLKIWSFAEMLIVYEIEPEKKRNFFKLISKYASFARNVDDLGDRAKKRFFRQKSIFAN